MTEEQKVFIDNLFSSEDKTKAFDLIAEKYYFGNFGTMSKTDFETLLFSIYIEQILDKSEEDMSTYSDYTLSKQLGITQSKVSNLKVKKELIYPRKGFDWKISFSRICENVQYDNGKIKLFVPDKNLYLELKHRIESNGGYVEVQLNSTLLQTTPQAFISLITEICTEKDKKLIEKEIIKLYQQNEELSKKLTLDTVGNTLKDMLLEIGIDMVPEAIAALLSVVSIFDGVSWIRPCLESVSKVMLKKLKQN